MTKPELRAFIDQVLQRMEQLGGGQEAMGLLTAEFNELDCAIIINQICAKFHTSGVEFCAQSLYQGLRDAVAAAAREGSVH